MIDFLNEHLPNLQVSPGSLQPIYIDHKLINDHLINFNNDLLINLKDYYLSKNNANIIRYNLESKGPSDKYDSNDIVFTLTNIDNKYSIVVSLTKDNNFVTIEFYLNIDKNKIRNNTKIKGTIFVMSNFINNGISVQLLDIVYQYLENQHFEEDNLFCRIHIN